MDELTMGLRSPVLNIMPALGAASQVIAYNNWLSTKAERNRVEATSIQSPYIDESDGKHKWKFDASFSTNSWAGVWRYGDYVLVSFLAIASNTIEKAKTRNIITNLPTCTKRIYLTPSIISYSFIPIEVVDIHDDYTDIETEYLRVPSAIKQCVCAIRPEEYVKTATGGYYKSTILQVDGALNPTEISPGHMICATFDYITSDPLPT